MLKLVYNFVLLLVGILMLPKLAWDCFVYKKYRRSFKERLGLKAPRFSIPANSMKIWVHAVSMGETKAVVPLVQMIRDQYPQAAIFFSSTTETGHDEAKKTMPGLSGYFFLPIDFSWAVKNITRQLNPDLLILVESEFWYNLVHAVKNVVLVNGKISELSYKRFRHFSFFAKRLFSRFGLLCLQSQRYASRFASLGIDPAKIVVTGNLKFDQPLQNVDILKWKQELGITDRDRVITIGSTHAPEEEWILDSLEKIGHDYPTLKILLVPRHPERFNAVAELLARKGIAYARFSDHKPKTGNERIILIDAMGILNPCYRVSELAIVGGSFAKHLTGHNIFEPAALGVPVLFGPYMESQKDLVEIVTSACAGQQISIEDLPKVVPQYLQHPPTHMRQAGLQLAQEVHGATHRTYQAIAAFCKQTI